MHGLINRAFQDYLTARFGEALWAEVAARARVPEGGFERLLVYADQLTEDVLAAAAALTGHGREQLLSGFGTWLVPSAPFATPRRLLRFGGRELGGLIDRLDLWRERAVMAVPDLDLPRLRVRRVSDHMWRLRWSWERHGYAAAGIGFLSGLAAWRACRAEVALAEPEVGGEAVIRLRLEPGRPGAGECALSPAAPGSGEVPLRRGAAA